MDKKTLYKKAEKAMTHAFSAAKQSVKLMSEKAGEAAHVTKLLLEKAAVEHRVTKKFAQLGGLIYERALRQGRPASSADEDIQALIEETRKLDLELAQIEAELVQEKRQKSKA